jgi:antitoxin (DNA-binding transcriptional repressor) of toxin-antitoxin stability system
MSTVTLEEAQADLAKLIKQLHPGEEIIITHGQKAVARLRAEELPKRKPRQPGNCQGLMTIVADDEDHLKDFAEYME